MVDGVGGPQAAAVVAIFALVYVAATLSAVFSNDIVCLAVAPVLVHACLARRLDPVPLLLALACASNIGSAATLIGNPQNMLIGEVLKLDFAAYVRDALPPVALSLLLLWAMLARSAVPLSAGNAAPAAAAPDDAPPFDAWQTAKGLAVAAGLVAVFLFTDWPRDVAALVGAGVLLLSQRFHSSQVMGLIDWELLILFMGLFVVNHALAQTGVTLALVSTLAGNLLIVGSIANIIAVDAARRQGVVIDWKRHARTGVPVTLAVTAAWLAWRP